MIDVTIRFQVDGQDLNPTDLTEDFELAEMLEYTGEQIRQFVQTKLKGVRCPEHDQPPRVIVTLAYSSETGQMEPSYHLDTCCQQLLLRSAQALNH